ncbi:MAG: hypothetical protein IJ659_07200 [Alloprevotella sp.]|nr:hypothetical protein [Alloprevotella sp.]
MTGQQNTLYRFRSFNDKFSDIMQFLREEWRTLLVFTVYFILPLSLLQALALPDMFSLGRLVDQNDAGMRVVLSGVFYALCTLTGEVIVASIAYSVMRIHFFREGGTKGITFRTFWPDMRHSLWRTFLYMLLAGLLVGLGLGVYILFVIITMRIGFIMAFVDLLLLPVLLVLLLPFSLSLPRVLLTDDGIWASLRDGYRLGWKTLGGVLAIFFVLQLIVNMVTGICSMPAMVCMVIDMFSSMGEDVPIANNPLFLFAEYLSNVLYSFVNYAGAVVLLVGLGIQYGHAAEKIDGVTAAESVSSFDTL